MEEFQEQTWWQRNWKWAVPSGGCLLIVICIVSFVGYGVYKAVDTISENTGIFAFVKVTDPSPNAARLSCFLYVIMLFSDNSGILIEN